MLDGSETDTLEGIERLRSDTEPGKKVQLVSTDCSSLNISSLSICRLESETASFQELPIHSDTEANIDMDHSKANKLIQDQHKLQDEIEDLVPASITKDEALQLR